MKRSRITPFFVLLLVGLAASISTTLYYLFFRNIGQEFVTGILALIITFVLLGILFVERVIVRNNRFPIRKVRNFEFMIIAGLILAYLAALSTR